MKKQIKKINILAQIFFVFLLVFLPSVGFSQCGVRSGAQIPGPCPTNSTEPATGLAGIIAKISALFSAILPVLISFGVLYFIWGVIQYMIADGEEAKTKGRDTIVYGIIGLAVIVSIWGLVAILNQTLGLGGTTGLVGVNAPDVSKLVTQATGTCTAITPQANFAVVLNYFTCIIGSSVVPFIFALAMVSFIWGAVNFLIINADEEAKREQGKQFMLWGIIALTVMISVWGLVNILGSTFGINTSVLPTVSPNPR